MQEGKNPLHLAGELSNADSRGKIVKLFVDNGADTGSLLERILRNQGWGAAWRLLSDKPGIAGSQAAADIARLTAPQDTHPELVHWGSTFGLLLGKYRLELDPKHISQTCVVIFALMLGRLPEDREQAVALKFMWVDEAMDCEVEQRKPFAKITAKHLASASAKHPDSQSPRSPCVALVGGEGEGYIYAKHIKERHMSPDGAHPFAAFPQIQLSDEVGTSTPTKLCHVLVMERGAGGDLTDIISHSNIAGVNVARVTDILAGIAERLQQMAELNVMHGDVKGRNFVLMAESQEWAAIDLDAATNLVHRDAHGKIVPPGKAGLKPTSSGFLPPEQAKVVLEWRLAGHVGQLKDDAMRDQLPDASVQYDMWAFGVMAYQLVTGRQVRARIAAPR